MPPSVTVGNPILAMTPSLVSGGKRGTPVLNHVLLMVDEDEDLVGVGISDGEREEDDICWVTSLHPAPCRCQSVCPVNPQNYPVNQPHCSDTAVELRCDNRSKSPRLAHSQSQSWSLPPECVISPLDHVRA